MTFKPVASDIIENRLDRGYVCDIGVEFASKQAWLEACHWYDRTPAEYIMRFVDAHAYRGNRSGIVARQIWAAQWHHDHEYKHMIYSAIEDNDRT